jgi:hypothetical protein
VKRVRKRVGIFDAAFLACAVPLAVYLGWTGEIVGLAGTAAVLILYLWRRFYSEGLGYCPSCGANLAVMGMADQAACPRCGANLDSPS